MLDDWLLLRISVRFSVLRIKCWDQDRGRSEKCEPRTDKTFVTATGIRTDQAEDRSWSWRVFRKYFSGLGS